MPPTTYRIPEMIGVFGGTFDPVHFGHLRTALEVGQALALERVHLIPARQPPHRAAPKASPEHRLAMLRLAVAGQPGFVVDEREMRRDGPSFMADTLASLRAEVGQSPLCLILGLDAFLGLGSWERWEAIPALAHLVVVHRPGWSLEQTDLRGSEGALKLLREARVEQPRQLLESPSGHVYLQAVTPLEIAATAIRGGIAGGHSPRYLVPDAVWRYIEEQGLYRPADNRKV